MLTLPMGMWPRYLTTGPAVGSSATLITNNSQWSNYTNLYAGYSSGNSAEFAISSTLGLGDYAKLSGFGLSIPTGTSVYRIGVSLHFITNIYTDGNAGVSFLFSISGLTGVASFSYLPGSVPSQLTVWQPVSSWFSGTSTLTPTQVSSIALEVAGENDAHGVSYEIFYVNALSIILEYR